MRAFDNKIGITKQHTVILDLFPLPSLFLEELVFLSNKSEVYLYLTIDRNV